ncbi:hypothetical protein K435DRAFT_800454 [Dendrothele bispora CBS 962.96]|uniref:Uncharacterized protein n=1 Tax=Dendrothele bispora (strain CBS 962.96) TaxID=1314807 RepID=A0A4S8LSN4_DENBC|nr:hypothetical protein K435DRAFT_800454 [Dendrothele bispora CBS 962.96]
MAFGFNKCPSTLQPSRLSICYHFGGRVEGIGCRQLLKKTREGRRRRKKKEGLIGSSFSTGRPIRVPPVLSYFIPDYPFLSVPYLNPKFYKQRSSLYSSSPLSMPVMFDIELEGPTNVTVSLSYGLQVPIPTIPPSSMESLEATSFSGLDPTYNRDRARDRQAVVIEAARARAMVRMGKKVEKAEKLGIAGRFEQVMRDTGGREEDGRIWLYVMREGWE